MKLHWLGIILGITFYILALIPGVLPHRVDMTFMILSGLLIVSFTIIGFDIPTPRKKLAVSSLLIGCLILLAGVLMAISGHPYILFIVAVPSLGFIFLALKHLHADMNGDKTSKHGDSL